MAKLYLFQHIIPQLLRNGCSNTTIHTNISVHNRRSAAQYEQCSISQSATMDLNNSSSVLFKQWMWPLRNRGFAFSGGRLIHNIHTDSGAQPTSCPGSSKAALSTDKAKHSSPSITEVKVAWSFTSIQPCTCMTRYMVMYTAVDFMTCKKFYVMNQLGIFF
jgi:hypothetical protein